MQIFELLDRFELLFKTDSFFVDLRKVILNDDKFALFRLVQERNKSALLEGLRKCNDDENFDMSSFSRGQLQSKLWLVNELKKCNIELGTVYLCAGWYATLATMLFESGIKIDKIRSFDVDPSCVSIAEVFNKPWLTDQWRFKSITQDIMDIDYNKHTWQYWSNVNNRMSKPITDNPDTIINTSCEHIANFKDWYTKIPDGKLVILQSNNYFKIKDHINCSESLAHFAEATPISKVLFEGELVLEHYNRYMRIGYK